MTDWKQQRKIALLPGAVRTPEVALAQTLEKARAGHVKSVYVGIQWEDGTFVGDWSNMAVSDLALHAMTCQREAESVFFTGAPTP